MIATFLLQLLYPPRSAKKCPCRILPALEMEDQPYRFEPDLLPDSTNRDIEGRAHHTDVSESVIVTVFWKTDHLATHKN